MTTPDDLLQTIKNVAEATLTTETEVSMLLLTILGMEDEDEDASEWAAIQDLFDIFSDTSREHLRFLCETCVAKGLLDRSEILHEHYGTLGFRSLVTLFPTYEELAAA